MNVRTQQQDVTAAYEKIAELKLGWLGALEKYLELRRAGCVDCDAALLECQQKANAYFNYIENFVGNSSLLGAHEDALWAHGFAEDCVEVLKCMPRHFDLIGRGFESSEKLTAVPYMPGNTAFANMQRMVVAYIEKEETLNLKNEFRAAKLPIYGFDNKAKNIMKIDKILSFVFGTVFLSVMLVIAWLKPQPSKFQYSVFWTALALAAAGIGAVIPGTISVNVSKWVRAGGAIALFVIVYFWLPAQIT